MKGQLLACARERRHQAALVTADKAAPPLQLPHSPIHASAVMGKNRTIVAAAIGAKVIATDPEIASDVEGMHIVVRFKKDVATELQVTPVAYRAHRDRALVLTWLDVDIAKKINGRAVRVEPSPIGLTIIDNHDAWLAQQAAAAKAAAEQEQRDLGEAR